VKNIKLRENFNVLFKDLSHVRNIIENFLFLDVAFQQGLTHSQQIVVHQYFNAWVELSQILQKFTKSKQV